VVKDWFPPGNFRRAVLAVAALKKFFGRPLEKEHIKNEVFRPAWEGAPMSVTYATILLLRQLTNLVVWLRAMTGVLTVRSRQSLPGVAPGSGKSQRIRGFRAGIPAARGLPNATDQKGSKRAMDTTQLVCLSQELAAYQSMDSIANNLANVSTPGFKGETPKFQEYLDLEKPAEGQTGTQAVSFVQQTGMIRDMSEGHVDITHAPFDLAINGQGYFAVTTPNGTRYTRDGHFSLDASGRIVDEAGDPVQAGGGDITIQQTDGDIHIAADGTVSGVNGQIGQIDIVDFANDRALVKEGGSLYSTTQVASIATNATVQQGAIESSNVQPVVEISKMIETMRAYQAVINLSTSQANAEQQTLDKLATVQS